MREFLRINLFWLAVAFIGGVVLAPLLEIRGIGPDFSIIALVTLALAAGSYPATCGGFLLGVVLDLSSPTLLGTQSLINSCLGFGLGRLRNRLAHGMPLVEIIVVALAVLIHDLVYLLVLSFASGEPVMMQFLMRSVPVAVYSGLAAVPVLRLAAWSGLIYRED